MRRHALLLGLAVAALAPSAATATSFTFATLPASGVLSGAAGETLGFGYTLTNPSPADWLVLTSLDTGVFLDGTPDSALFDFPVLAPGESRTTPFAIGSAGLFAFTWDPSAPIGSLNAGLFVIGGEWWSGDPAAGGAFLASATAATATYQVQLVPEAGTLVLLSIAGVIGWPRSSRARHLSRGERSR